MKRFIEKLFGIDKIKAETAAAVQLAEESTKIAKDAVAAAERATEEYRKAGFTGHVYLMPVGGVESVYTLNNKNVALLAMKHGLRYSDRLQVPLFKNEWGT